MKHASFILFIILFLCIGVAILFNTRKIQREVINVHIRANTSTFKEGDIVVMTPYGIRKAMTGDDYDTIGIVIVSDVNGKIELKWSEQ